MPVSRHHNHSCQCMVSDSVMQTGNYSRYPTFRLHTVQKCTYHSTFWQAQAGYFLPQETHLQTKKILLSNSFVVKMHNYMRAIDTCHVALVYTYNRPCIVETLTKPINSSVWWQSMGMYFSVHSVPVTTYCLKLFQIHSFRCGFWVGDLFTPVRHWWDWLAYVSQIFCSTKLHTPIGGFSTEFLRGFPLSLVPFQLLNISKSTEMRKTKRGERQVTSCLGLLTSEALRIHCKKGITVFPSTAGMSLTKFSLVCDMPIGDGKTANLFLQCFFRQHRYVWLIKSSSFDCLGSMRLW